MKFLTLYYLFTLLSVFTFIAPQAASSPFQKFEALCKQIPTFRKLYQTEQLHNNGKLKAPADYKRFRLVSLSTFEKTVDAFFKLMQRCLQEPKQWFGTSDHISLLLDPNHHEFFPYAHKLVVSPETLALFKGDLHGDIHSLCVFIRFLQEQGYTTNENPLKISDPNLRLIFLGDYVDRGVWGTEVIYLLMLLKLTNPTQVFLVRGNHEDPELALHFGFKDEFFHKFADEDPQAAQRCYGKLSKLYEYLPVVLYLGSGSKEKTDFVQCCHGGIEFGYNPKELFQAPETTCFQLMHTINRLSECRHLPQFRVQENSGSHKRGTGENSGAPKLLINLCQDFKPLSPTEPFRLGFLWNDFAVDPLEINKLWSARGFSCNKELTHATLLAASTPTKRLVAIIRAHQHCPKNSDPMMKLMLESHGCAVLWENKEGKLAWGSVLTLLLSPDTLTSTPNVGGNAFSGFDYDTSVLVKTGKELGSWTMSVINNAVYTKERCLPANT